MRHKGFIRMFLDNGQAEFVPFSPEHYREAGVGYAPVAGMPLLEAYQLVNNWNLSQGTPRFVYCLES